MRAAVVTGTVVTDILAATGAFEGAAPIETNAIRGNATTDTRAKGREDITD